MYLEATVLHFVVLHNTVYTIKLIERLEYYNGLILVVYTWDFYYWVLYFLSLILLGFITCLWAGVSTTAFYTVGFILQNLYITMGV